jgi:murein DD-endopeptidase MepM/ murein hydrolase activator NlpD
MRLRLLIAGVVLPLLLWASLPLVSSGAPQGSAATLQQKISKKQQQLNATKGKEQVLSTTVKKYSSRINKIQSKVDVLRAKQDKIQRDLDSKRAELEQIRADLRTERRRLAGLRVRLADGRQKLEARLKELYESEPPDLVSVVLNSSDFSDLLEQAEFLRRIEAQDKRIISRVRSAKTDAETTAAQLSTLESRQQKVTARVFEQRNAVDKVRSALVEQQRPMREARYAKTRLLRRVKEDRHEIQEDLGKLQAASAKVTGDLQNLPTQAIKGGNGPWDWPVNGPITGAFGEQRPGHIHAGIDIAVPVGTPIRAVANGRVVLLEGTGASGGYGNYTCLQHTATLTSCYAHQASFAVSSGQTVSKNQVIGYVGMTGHTFGPHLHFEARINGVPVQPLNYL